MSTQKNSFEEAARPGATNLLAPAVLGCAAGVLMSENLGGKARRAAAFTLLSIGVAVVAPAIAEFVSRQVDGPATARGQRRTRQLIRDSFFPMDSDFLEFEPLEASEHAASELETAG